MGYNETINKVVVTWPAELFRSSPPKNKNTKTLLPKHRVFSVLVFLFFGGDSGKSSGRSICG
jgi:hypothetical protein